jgi:hypothetical protein
MMILLFSTFVNFVNVTYADVGTEYKDILNTAPTVGSEADTIKKMASNVLGIIKVIALVVSVAYLMLIGTVLMFPSMQSADISKFKEKALPFAIGAMLIFCATQITEIVANFAKSIQTT